MYPDIIGDGQQNQQRIQGLTRGESVNYDNNAIARTLFAAGNPITIGAGGSGTVQIQLQVPMRLEQLVLVTDLGTGSQLRVTGFRVGPANQIVSNGGSIAAVSFHPLSFNTNNMQGNTAPPGVDIIVDLVNPSQVAETVLSHVRGTALTR